MLALWWPTDCGTTFALVSRMPAPPSSQPDTHRSPAAAPHPRRRAEASGVPEHGYGYGGSPMEQGPATYGDEFGEFDAPGLRRSVNRQTAPERVQRVAPDHQVHYSSELLEPPAAGPPPHHLTPTETGDHEQKARGFELARDVGVELMVASVLLVILGIVLAAFLQVFIAIPVLLVAAALFFAAKRAARRSAEKAREHQLWLDEDQP